MLRAVPVKNLVTLLIFLLVVVSICSLMMYSSIQSQTKPSVADLIRKQSNIKDTCDEEEVLKLKETHQKDIENALILQQKWSSLIGNNTLDRSLKNTLRITRNTLKYDLNADPVCYLTFCDIEPNNAEAYAECNEDATAWNKLGVQSMERYIDGDNYGDSNLKNAEYYFSNATKLDRKCVRAYVNLGLVYMEQNLYSDAIRKLTMATSLDPSQAKYWAIRAFLHELVGDEKNFNLDREKALELDPYIIERRYFGILLGNTTKPEHFKLFPLVFHYGDGQQEFSRKALIYMEFAKVSISNYAQLVPTTTDDFLFESWITLRNILPPFILKWAAKNYRDLIRDRSLTLGDPQTLRWRGINDRVARILQFQLVDLVRKVVASNIMPTYTYFGGYLNGSYLNPHSDRPPCEFSISLTLGQYPEDEPWGLGLGIKPLFEKNNNYAGADNLEWPPEEERRTAYLKSGDGLLLMGRQLVHFREGILGEGKWLNQAFLNYVPEGYVGDYE